MPHDTVATRAYRRRADVYATEQGNGPPVVFAHGTLMDRTMFEPQQAALADDYRTIAFDFRARTDQYHTTYNLYDLADDTAALLDALNIDSCVLAGMSMGGFMSLRFAKRYPERVDGLVLIDSGAHDEEEGDREQYGEMIEQTRKAEQVPEQLAEVTKSLLFGATTIEERAALANTWVDRWRTYPGEAVYQEVSSWLARDPFFEDCADIVVPTLVVHGEEDISIDMSEAEATVEALPEARLKRIPKAGHSSNIENPEPVNEALQEFLADIY